MSKDIAKQLLLNKTCNNCFWNFSNECTLFPSYKSKRNRSLPKNNTCLEWTK